MKFYTGWQWLLIDAATQFGLDKLTFEERIAWAEQNINQLELLQLQAETVPLYQKAVMAIRKAQQGFPTGHMVGVDATCSGIQMMSVLTGCINGAKATGLVDPDVRADAYTQVTQAMNDILGASNAVNVSRKDAKQALMTSFYGSKMEPQKLFGKETPELEAFYEAAMAVAPGPWQLLQDLLASWQPHALAHQWKMPDGYDARVKVMTAKKLRIEVDELDHASFTYEYYDNVGTKKGLSNAANITHSMDAYVLREMHRRCNYDREVIERAAQIIEMEQIERSLGKAPGVWAMADKFSYYCEQYTRSTLASAAILPHLSYGNAGLLSTRHLQALSAMVNGMLQYKPFPLVTVHDEFKAHANNINWVRWQYKEILAEIADSSVIDDLLSQIHGIPTMFDKYSFNLSELVKQSNYALC